MTAETVSSNRCFGGWQHHVQHDSDSLNCTMRFALYLPPQAEQGPVPAVYWLSGLTCTDENFVHKAGAQRVAAELGVALVAPDTSPRGEGVPDDPDGAYDFGLGAGFYVNATQAPFDRHYRMYDYITRELPELVERNFPIRSDRRAISGHSMGGHGALVAALNEPGRYTSVSAFAPIVNPTEVPWGEKAFSGYLGDDRDAWKAYDSCELMRRAERFVPALVDQGDADGFLQTQLQPEQLKAVAEERGYPLTLRWQPGYDHSYYFIASFIEEHLRFHGGYLVG